MSDTAPENDTTNPTEPNIIIDTDDALRGLRMAVAEKGADHVYTKPEPSLITCVYAWEVDGELQPQCIAGVALALLGVPVELMYRLANDLSVSALAERLTDHGYSITPNAQSVLRAAQLVQDSAAGEDPPPHAETTWGTALARAEVLAANFAAVAAELAAQVAETTTGETEEGGSS